MIDTCEDALEWLREQARTVARTVISRWPERAALDPGHGGLDELDLDHLPDLVHHLAAAAHPGAGPTQGRALVEAAREHGRYRRDEGQAEALLLREYHVLRRLLWDACSTGGIAPTACTAAMLRIDLSITQATTASLHGFHHDAGGLDAEAIFQRLKDDWEWEAAFDDSD